VSDVWIANASPVIALAKIGYLNLLTDLSDELILPEPVAAEILVGPENDPARQAVERGWGVRLPPTKIPKEIMEWSLGEKVNFERTYLATCSWAEAHGISVHQKYLDAKKAGEFDGLSATMNTRYSAEEQTYYLAHALGSIVRWSQSFAEVREMFAELRAAKNSRRENPARLESAIQSYQAFEVESSEFAVWLLGEIGQGDVIPMYTNFMRSDLEALTQFHRIGVAPVWRDFFAQWNRDVRRGLRKVEPYHPKPIPEFKHILIERQEIIQKQPEQSDG
jgi:hypothetical protein